MKKIITLFFVLIIAKAWAQPCVPNTNSLSFNGSSQYVSINSQTNLDSIKTAVTVEAWVNASSFAATSAQGSIFCMHSWTGPNSESGFVLRAGGSGQLSFNIGGDSASLGTSIHWREVLSQTGALTLNTWYHVAGTFDGSHLRLYINGTLAADTLFSGVIRPSTFNPKISRLSDNGVVASRYWSGKIDEIRIFNRALSQTEISDSMSVHIVPAAQNGLVGYWRMNEGSGTTLNDISASNNSGTISGAVYSTNVPFNSAPAVPTIAFIGGQLVASSCPNYAWYLNGNPLGITTQTFAPTLNGIYTVVDTNATCSASSLPYNLTALGVEEHGEAGRIRISPNPAHDVVQVDPGKFSGGRIEITDITGRVMLFRDGYPSGSFDIPLGRFAEGIYLIRFTANESVVTKKLVIE